MAKNTPVCNKYGFPYDNTIIALRKAIPLGSIYIADYVNPFGFDPREVCDFFDSFISYLNEMIGEDGKNADDEDVFNEYDNEENLIAWLGCFEESPFSIRLPRQTPYYGYGFGQWLEQFDEAKERKRERKEDKARNRERKVA